ncbi:MAG TPA: hypothetical protein ACHBY5_06565 [Arsenophonus apicola]|uniref:hypothetical protein n=1 Tax=Arsenophonus endosymbiont of Apis mellifera TaxID=1541805 RepID=UPI001F3362EF|nr:hypothetical protein [Arsenophonus endosymbiont of Apis mellifera]
MAARPRWLKINSTPAHWALALAKTALNIRWIAKVAALVQVVPRWVSSLSPMQRVRC